MMRTFAKVCCFLLLFPLLASAFNDEFTRQLQSQLKQGNLRVADLDRLVEGGADVNAAFNYDKRNLAPLYYLLLMSNGCLNRDLFDRFLKHGADATAAAKSAILDLNLPFVHTLLEAGADLFELLAYCRELLHQMQAVKIEPVKLVRIIAYLEERVQPPELPSLNVTTVAPVLNETGVGVMVSEDDTDTAIRHLTLLTLATAAFDRNAVNLLGETAASAASQ